MRHVLIWLAVALVIVWGLARVVFSLANLAIHLVLVAALVLVILWLVQRLRS